MKVSVVIPCFNRSKQVGRAIKSVLDQRYADLEVIVVDDGSDDGAELAQVVREYENFVVRLLKLPQNSGQNAATNFGIRAASGRWIALLDADDYWRPSKLGQQVRLFEKLQKRNAIIYVQSEVITCQDDIERRSIMPERPIRSGEKIAHYLFSAKGFIQSSGLFFERDLALTIPFRDGLRRHTDYDFLMACERHGCSFHMCHEPLVEIDWRDAHLRRGGRDMSPSFEFLEFNRDSFDSRSRTQFVLQQILMPLVCRRKSWHQMRRAWGEISMRHLGLKGWISLTSGLLFHDLRILKWVAKLKRIALKPLTLIYLLMNM